VGMGVISVLCRSLLFRSR